MICQGVASMICHQTLHHSLPESCHALTQCHSTFRCFLVYSVCVAASCQCQPYRQVLWSQQAQGKQASSTWRRLPLLALGPPEAVRARCRWSHQIQVS